jgi:hypothetical protein
LGGGGGVSLTTFTLELKKIIEGEMNIPGQRFINDFTYVHFLPISILIPFLKN